jgi:hypothetical protein
MFALNTKALKNIFGNSRMSLLPNITYANPTTALFAPAGSGGGGSNYPADATFSTITMNGSGTLVPNVLVGSPSDAYQLTIAAGNGVYVEDRNVANPNAVWIQGHNSAIVFTDPTGITCAIASDGTGHCSIGPVAGSGIALTVSSINSYNAVKLISSIVGTW